MLKPFIPESFEPPTTFEAQYFTFRVLEDSVAALDFETVMSSQNRLRGIFGSKSQWPKMNMTLEENIESLKVHKQQFEAREAFAYSIFNDSNKKCLG